MKTLKKQSIVFYLFLCAQMFLGSFLCKTKHETKPLEASTVNNSQTITLGSLLHDLTEVNHVQTQQAFQEAEKKAQKLEAAVAQNTTKLKQQAEHKSQELQKQAAREVSKITERYAQEAELFKIAVEKQTAELKKKAAEQILLLVAQAENQALQAKQAARQELLKKKIAGVEIATADASWKEQTRQEFLGSLKFLEGIITQGESPQEAEDFLSRLKNQEQWLDTTLATTTVPSEEAYIKLTQKMAVLGNIVATQKDTEKLLEQRIKTEKQPLPNMSRLRLMLLYENNDQLQKKMSTAKESPAALSDKEKQNIIDQVIHLAVQQTKPIPLQPTIESEIKTELAQTKTLLEKANQEKTALKNLAKTKLEATATGQLACETRLRKAKNKLSHEQQKMLVAKKERISAQIKSDIITQLADRCIEENARGFDTKKTLLDEQMQTLDSKGQQLALKEQLLDENKVWLEKLIQSLTPQQPQGTNERPSKIQQEQENKAALEHELVVRSIQGKNQQKK